ncbi:MAG: site-2 protease family protein [Phycisphaerales bacterium]
MFDLPGPFGTFANFLTIVVGFGLIVFIHELGHFVAAKWAGIRVLAFSIGFGNVLFSYRKGIGFRRGSSEPEYRKRIYGESTDSDGINTDSEAAAISPTEYRLSMLPLGGYVKMLGQEDLNPEATSNAPDSYQNRPVGKRMVVICAGVVMNLITAAVLFVLVFMIGLRSMPAKVGYVAQDSPAQLARSLDSTIPDGLQRGDHIVSINSKPVFSFEDILPEVAMTHKGSPVPIEVERPGIDGVLVFEALPTKSAQSGLLDIGIMPAISTTLKPSPPENQSVWTMLARSYQLDGLSPGDQVISVNHQPIDSPFDLIEMADQSNGQPLNLEIARADEKTTITHIINPIPEMQVDLVQIDDAIRPTSHLLGLTGVLMVNPYADPEDIKQGLKPGDIFARVDSTAYPSMSRGIAIIHEHAGESLDLTVLRKDDQGIQHPIDLTVEVSLKGSVGFYPANSADFTNLVAHLEQFVTLDSGSNRETPVDMPADDLIEFAGSRITRVGSMPIESLRDVQIAIFNASESLEPNDSGAFSIPVTLELPLPIQPDGSVPTAMVQLVLGADQLEQVHSLGWTVPGSLGVVDMFAYEQIIDKADSPLAAISRGMNKSRRVMIQTYLTFLRLFEGSVQVKHLKGPVGIAHLGTQIASQGFVWVLFFMALISVNLAVINFLPLPIVDGGQFLMLVYEWIRGKPVPIVFQNITTLAGLALIGTLFLYVTFNDIKSIFGL